MGEKRHKVLRAWHIDKGSLESKSSDTLLFCKDKFLAICSSFHKETDEFLILEAFGNVEGAPFVRQRWYLGVLMGHRVTTLQQRQAIGHPSVSSDVPVDAVVLWHAQCLQGLGGVWLVSVETVRTDNHKARATAADCTWKVCVHYKSTSLTCFRYRVFSLLINPDRQTIQWMTLDWSH